MKNVNDDIAIKYYQLLKPVCAPVPVFRDGFVPNDLKQDSYVAIYVTNSQDASTIGSSDTLTTVQVGIYSRNAPGTNPNIINDLADKVYSTIMPSTVSVIKIDSAQVLTTELSGDNSPMPFDTGSQIFINRFITFNHKIFHSLN